VLGLARRPGYALKVRIGKAEAEQTIDFASSKAPFSVDEIVDDGQRFFGTLSRGLASVVQEAASRWAT
jgi:hypothetical protein